MTACRPHRGPHSHQGSGKGTAMPGPKGVAHRGPSGPRAPSEKRKARPGFRTRTHLNCRPGKPFPGPLPRRQREPRGSARPARVGVRSRRAGRTARALAFLAVARDVRPAPRVRRAHGHPGPAAAPHSPRRGKSGSYPPGSRTGATRAVPPTSRGVCTPSGVGLPCLDGFRTKVRHEDPASR